MKKYIIIAIVCLQLIVLTSCNSNAQTTTIPISEFEKAITQKEVQILDVRTASEYQSGHLKNALQANWNNEEEFKERAKALDKTKPIYTYCLSGARSNEAMQWLKQNGFVTVYNMKGGINAWKQADKPVEGASNVKQISEQEYLSSIPKDKVVLVDIGAEWCPPCKKMKPIIDSLEKQEYTVIKIDGGSQTELCKQLKVESFPVFIVYKNGKETERKQGVLSQKELKLLLQ
jgi:rhodanese-related sulfurtransferase/glutaredoxin